MLEKAITTLFGSKYERDLKELLPLLHKINEFESTTAAMPAEAFPAKTQEFRNRYQEGESLDAMLPEAFAMVREAARRTLGERHYDVQLLGGIVLHQGKIMEMKTGEGKTLSSVTAAYLNAIPGEGVHVVTVNDYLAERDAQWMKPVYSFLGVTVGSILSDMDNEARKESYNCDITYGTNNEFGFDYLRDNMRWSMEGRVQRSHHYCIIDEIDSILIDEARTPLIISGQAEDDTKKFREVNRLIPMLTECAKDPETGTYPEENPVGDYQLDEKSKKVTFTDEGMNHIEELLLKNGIISDSLFIDDNFEYIHYFTQAVKAHKLFHIDVDYVVKEKQVQIVDEFTGRILHGRRYSDGLHQAIEAKEGIQVAKRNKTLATITFQNFFRMYDKISGMTGTADTEAREFAKIYNLEVVVIPTNRPLARIDENDVIFLNEKFKYQAICDEIAQLQKKGQPVLVGTVSIEKSELLSTMLTAKGVRHEVLNAKNHAREALIIAEAGAKGAVTIATNMAGRGTDIKLGGNPEFRARAKAGTEASEEEFASTYKKEYAKWKENYEEVKSLGGLYILGTERHESRRIDNQLRGRSGRQGDPGTSRFFLSLDDNLMRLFARDNMRNLMAKAGMDGGDPLYHPWINKAIERAQSRVEERNFEIRKHLLEYDDVLNEQRKFIYDQRDEILSDTDLKQRVFSAVSEMVDEAVDQAFKTGDRQETIAAKLEEKLKEFLLFIPSLDSDGEAPLDWKNQENFSRQIFDRYRKDMEQKIEAAGERPFNDFIKYQYLRQIDIKWQEHLDQLEELREAVYLRAYGQKNPLLEYKLEGFDIFDKLIYDIRTNIAKMVINVQIQEPEAAKRRRMPVGAGTASHKAMGQFGGAEVQGGGERKESSPQGAQVKRSTPKVGRNDPCPCGSGKKYKHCCGR
ncbi:preprotein translocase subunit SecA [Sediminispirochaeta smaragdinae]|jgi:preprotein translocase subunit SecA|uniref:Protein translocase subunit SecA n=1 Tax=Sediminispirochaeta smaragdinae (strain DSM 11293 / JCM 15392 / SEBR 4228) TaxID=573413 RepID=E1R4J4_SEDSS|nr:preprotein translocase subunit SecA [Sediminispirochaeta smaragdinae]ADK81735.1 preprotein translocase, SecA subunit [Sediminispirochaeta smaragdinae DSM 11293]